MVPSSELTYPTMGKGYHFQSCLRWGYISFQEGILTGCSTKPSTMHTSLPKKWIQKHNLQQSWLVNLPPPEKKRSNGRPFKENNHQPTNINSIQKADVHITICQAFGDLWQQLHRCLRRTEGGSS